MLQLTGRLKNVTNTTLFKEKTMAPSHFWYVRFQHGDKENSKRISPMPVSPFPGMIMQLWVLDEWFDFIVEKVRCANNTHNEGWTVDIYLSNNVPNRILRKFENTDEWH